jgi:hypothetical protein
MWSSSVCTAANRGSSSGPSWRTGNGSTAQTTIDHSAASRAASSSYKGRSPKMSGAITNPISIGPLGLAISAAVPPGKVMRITAEATHRRVEAQ